MISCEFHFASADGLQIVCPRWNNLAPWTTLDRANSVCSL